MARPPSTLTGVERRFGDEEIIVSKTDRRGIITYANDVFLRVSGYTEAELLGQPHNMIRHPDMPRTVFRVLWRALEARQEVFAYVLNLARNGDGYWVFAHVTPSYDPAGRHVGYHSNRRVPYPDAMPKVKALYARLLQEERQHAAGPAAATAGEKLLQRLLAEQQTDYPRFVYGLSASTCLEASV